MENQNLYETPRLVDDINNCYFYHTIDLPKHGEVKGNWDLRSGVNEYLGNVNFSGKRVLEVGTANGFLCFEMEKRGGDVVSFDLSKEYDWDVVPFAQYDYQSIALERKTIIDRLNNAYWLCHKLLNSKAKVVYNNVYNIPDQISPVNIVTFGSILLHLRDPFLALQNGLRFAKDTCIITELLRGETIKSKEPFTIFLPNAKSIEPKDTWWDLRPELIVQMIGILGFEDATVTYHSQMYEGKENQLYTVVGQRTSEFTF